MIRIGVDFGGTKIEAAAIDGGDQFLARVRAPNPGDYQSAIATIRELVEGVEEKAGPAARTIGVAIPGSISPATGRMRNANSTWLNGEPFDADLAAALGRPVILENDANCFALSEAVSEDAEATVFGAILGTGCGGGLVIGRKVLRGRNAVGGEWGHSPLPWPTPAEDRAHTCWCGRANCLETWISGPAFEADHAKAAGSRLTATGIFEAAASGDAQAKASAERYADRLGRGLAVICNLFDPDVIVLGGGVSRAAGLYAPTLESLRRHVFSDCFETRLRPPLHGDSSGVRGAAWLVPQDPP
jgi:fructokinase